MHCAGRPELCSPAAQLKKELEEQKLEIEDLQLHVKKLKDDMKGPAAR